MEVKQDVPAGQEKKQLLPSKVDPWKQKSWLTAAKVIVAAI